MSLITFRILSRILFTTSLYSDVIFDTMGDTIPMMISEIFFFACSMAADVCAVKALLCSFAERSKASIFFRIVDSATVRDCFNTSRLLSNSSYPYMLFSAGITDVADCKPLDNISFNAPPPDIKDEPMLSISKLFISPTRSDASMDGNSESAPLLGDKGSVILFSASENASSTI